MRYNDLSCEFVVEWVNALEKYRGRVVWLHLSLFFKICTRIITVLTHLKWKISWTSYHIDLCAHFGCICYSIFFYFSSIAMQWARTLYEIQRIKSFYLWLFRFVGIISPGHPSQFSSWMALFSYFSRSRLFCALFLMPLSGFQCKTNFQFNKLRKREFKKIKNTVVVWDVCIAIAYNC